jgi:protease-4
MKYEEVARIADGRIMTGEEALSLNLVDQLGGMDEAVRTAGKLAGIKGEPALIWPRPREPRLLDLLTEGQAASAAEMLMSRGIPKFLYRW